MTNFQLGLAIGIFLGVLATFVVLGIIQLYAEERQGKAALAKNQTVWEGLPETGGMLFANDYGAPRHLPARVLKEWADDAEIVCYLFILIE